MKWRRLECAHERAGERAPTEASARLRRPDRLAGASSPAHYSAALGTDAFRHVAIAYGTTPAVVYPTYAAGPRCGGPRRRPRCRRRHAVSARTGFLSRARRGALMKGDPLRGVHAFYSAASAEEWWGATPPRAFACIGRNALGGVSNNPSEFSGRPVPSGPASVSASTVTVLFRPDRLMIRHGRTKARERKNTTPVEIGPYTDDEIAADRRAVCCQRGPRDADPRVVGGRLRGRRDRPDGECARSPGMT